MVAVGLPPTHALVPAAASAMVIFPSKSLTVALSATAICEPSALPFLSTQGTLVLKKAWPRAAALTGTISTPG
jgi:hypothetical protein